MRFEDPILKQDGTLITKIDILLLRTAKVVAYPFLSVDDETYTPALRRLLAFCGYWFIFFGLLITILGLIGPVPVESAFGALYPSAVLGAFFIALSRWNRVVCTGTGTVAESRSDKIGALLSLIYPPPIFGFFMYSAALATGTPRAIELAICFAVGIVLVVMAFGYVRRLGSVPPKRKKARVFKLAHSHH